MFIPHDLKQQNQPSSIISGPRRILVLLLAVALFSAGSFGTALAGRVEEPAETGGRDPYVFELPNGNTLSFIPAHDESGRLLGYGISESMQQGTSSYHEIHELRLAGPAELFHALTPPGTNMPADMAEAFAQALPRDQGWALDHKTWNMISQQCNKHYFLESYPPFSGDTDQVTSFNDGPYTRPDLWAWDQSSTDDDVYWDGLSTARKADDTGHYYARVTRCKVSDYTYYYGPGVRLNGVTHEGGLGFAVYLEFHPGPLPNYGSSVDFTWYSTVPSNPVDWALTVHSAAEGDEFHIGYAYTEEDWSLGPGAPCLVPGLC